MSATITLYQACKKLGIWGAVKAYAEVWSLSENFFDLSTIEILILAKDNFNKLALKHHPDKQGDVNEYLRVRNAYEAIRAATVKNFIDTLKDEIIDIIYHESGSEECRNCVKWSDLVNTCITVACSGFEPLKVRGHSQYVMEIGNANSQSA